MRDTEKTTAWFRGVMLEKLNANSHKRHWNEADINWLFSTKLEEEYKELLKEINIINLYRSRGEDVPSVIIENAINECGDMSNILMFIADNIKNGVFDGSTDSDFLEPEIEL